jgi:hypothetical protein
MARDEAAVKRLIGVRERSRTFADSSRTSMRVEDWQSLGFLLAVLIE